MACSCGRSPATSCCGMPSTRSTSCTASRPTNSSTRPRCGRRPTPRLPRQRRRPRPIQLKRGRRAMAAATPAERAGQGAERPTRLILYVGKGGAGKTIRLLSMPESFQWYAGRIEAWRGRILRMVGPFLRGMVPNLDVVDVMNHMAVRVRELRAALADARRSSYRIVVTPDRMVLKEAQRAETYLNLFEYPIDAVIVNRVIAPSAAHKADGSAAATDGTVAGSA